MASCLTRSFTVHRTVFMCSRTSPFKFFSSLSPIYGKVSSSNCNSHQPICKKRKDLIPAQHRFFSLDAIQPFLDIITSDDQSQALKNVLVKTHDSTGLSWWATIFSASLALKLFIGLPCGVGQQHISSRLELTKIELSATAEGIKQKIMQKAKKERWTEQKLKHELRLEMIKQWKALIVKNNCHPFKNFILFLTQLPFWLLLTLGIREFAVDVAAMKLEYPVAQLQFMVGGPNWCQNLAVPDPTYILPTVNALSILTSTELNCLQADLRVDKEKRSVLNRKIIPNFLRLFAVIFFFISAVSPAGLSLFWASTSTISVLQSLLLMSPRVRRTFRIPATPSDLNKPYSQLWAAFLEKWRKLILRK